MKITVITRGRYHNNHVLRTLPAEILKKVDLYCHVGEIMHYEKFYGDKLKSVKEYIGENFSQARDFVIRDSDERYVLFIDDNVDFYVRTDETDFGDVKMSRLYKLQPNNNHNEQNILKHYENMFLQIVKALNDEDVAVAGISSRNGNNNVLEDVAYCQRLYAVWALDTHIYKTQIKERFSDVTIRQDFYIMLALLKAGYKNAIFYNYCFNKVGGANAAGGCSIYRTPQMANENALFLQEYFKPFVTAAEKSAANWSGDFKDIDVMYDVHVQWKKLFNYYKEKRETTQQSLF